MFLMYEYLKSFFFFWNVYVLLFQSFFYKVSKFLSNGEKYQLRVNEIAK